MPYTHPDHAIFVVEKIQNITRVKSWMAGGIRRSKHSGGLHLEKNSHPYTWWQRQMIATATRTCRQMIRDEYQELTVADLMADIR